MAGEKRFRTSLLGFKKSDVNYYIEKILKEFDDKLKENEDEISVLKGQVKDFKFRYDDMMKKSDQINEDRAKIAEVLVRAQEKAELMIEEARVQAMEEKKKLESLVEEEKEKLVDIKVEMKSIKTEIVSTLRKYESQINQIIGEDVREE